MRNPTVIVIGGPTAVGKTDLCLDLAQKFDTEILSADSRQIYREMNIGVAKPLVEELNLVPHHFINHVSIQDDYSAGLFEKEALSKLEDLFLNKDHVILSGGTGLYIRAVLEGLDQFPPADRSYWTEIFLSDGVERLQKELAILDPGYFDQVDRQNPHRLIRALSVIRATGKTFSSFLTRSKKNRPFESIKIALIREREELYQRINHRVDKMIERGLIQEVERLLPFKTLPALQTVGYKELFDFFEGRMTKDEAISKIKQHSRNYAKRQMTWFRNQGDWQLFHPEKDYNKVINYIEEQ